MRRPEPKLENSIRDVGLLLVSCLLLHHLILLLGDSRDINHNSRLDIRVYHKSQSKNRKKRNLVGSAYVSVGELIRRQSHPGCGMLQYLRLIASTSYFISDLSIRLSCPPPQKRSPTISGTRFLNCATLTLRLRPPSPLPPSSSVTLVASTSGSQHSDSSLSDANPSDIPQGQLPLSFISLLTDTHPQHLLQYLHLTNSTTQ